MEHSNHSTRKPYATLVLALLMISLWAACVAQISTLTMTYDDASWLVPLIVCFVLTGVMICVVTERVARCRKSQAVCSSIVETYFTLLLSMLLVVYVHVATFAELLATCCDTKNSDGNGMSTTTLLIIDILFACELVVLFGFSFVQGRLLNHYVQQEQSGTTVVLSAAEATASAYVQDASGDDHYA